MIRASLLALTGLGCALVAPTGADVHPVPAVFRDSATVAVRLATAHRVIAGRVSWVQEDADHELRCPFVIALHHGCASGTTRAWRFKVANDSASVTGYAFTPYYDALPFGPGTVALFLFHRDWVLRSGWCQDRSSLTATDCPMDELDALESLDDYLALGDTIWLKK